MITFLLNVLTFQSVKSMGYGVNRVNSYDILIQNISWAQEVIARTLLPFSSERKSNSDTILSLPTIQEQESTNLNFTTKCLHTGVTFTKWIKSYGNRYANKAPTMKRI